MAKDIYHYGKDGLFVGKGTADECPIEKGVFHCPKNATFDAVPMHNPETHRARYQPEFWPTGVAKEQGGKWVVELLPPPQLKSWADITAAAATDTTEQGQGA